MFREMRRKNQQLPHEEAVQILKNATSGVLALLGDEDYPYTVPLSHLYQDGRLYFHGAVEGHKADAVKRHPKASFCVVARDDVIPEEFTTRFVSVVAFGRIRIVEDEAEKRSAIIALAGRFSPGRDEAAKKEIDESWNRMHIFALDVEHMTGKESMALMQQRQAARERRTRP